MKVSNQYLGKIGEEFIEGLANKAFIKDWCHKSPKYDKGKQEKEICDLLVFFDGYLIIFQVKNTKVRSTGSEKSEFKKQDFIKNIDQLKGAKKTIFQKKPVMINDRDVKVDFGKEAIRDYLLVSCLVRDGVEVKYPCFINDNNEFVSILDNKACLAIFGELDTISDFINYFFAKKLFFKNSNYDPERIDEKDMLAYYLCNERNLTNYEPFGPNIGTISNWSEYINHENYLAKKNANKKSYILDRYLDHAHTAKNQNIEMIIRGLAKLNRICEMAPILYT
jgi:hypothetical protein